MDRKEIDTKSIENIEIDARMLPKDHKGSLGLDILKQYELNIRTTYLKQMNEKIIA